MIPTIPTGVLLGQYYKDLIASGVPIDVASQAVLIAAHGLTHDGELAVSEAVAA